MRKFIRLSRSGIEYLDYSWGIFSGCNNWRNGLCGGGGDEFNCWAKSIATRFRQLYPNGFEPTFYPEAILSPLYLKKPSRIGVGWVGDVIGYCRKVSERSMIYQTIMQCPWHTFFFLTKNTEMLPQWSPFPSNCFVGITVTADGDMTKAYQGLSQIEARVKYISCEPLLGAISMKSHRILEVINWVIIGAQTKPLKLPNPAWVREIITAANEANIPIFIKDNIIDNCRGEYRLGSELRQEMPLK
jgi:protein gp37